MPAKKTVGKKAQPIKQSQDWRAYVKNIKTKYVVLASISFVLLIVLNVLIFTSGTKSEADLKPHISSDVVQTDLSVQKTDRPIDNQTKELFVGDLSNNMGAVGKAMVQWMDLLVLLMVLGLVFGMIARFARMKL